MSDEVVDVLIVGAGAAGAAMAWSLSDTRMKIVCLEQGGWMNPAEYPSTQSDWELRQFGDFGLSPNGRGRPEDYPINDSGSPIARTSTRSAAARFSTPRTFRASTPATSRSGPWTGSRTTGRSTTTASSPTTSRTPR